MKNNITLLFFFMCCCIYFVSAQSIEPSSLKYNWKKKLCEKATNKPYSGKVEGYLSIKQPVNIAKARSFGLNLNSISEDPPLTTKQIDGFYLVGELLQGKEIGRWQYYTSDKTLIIEADFAKGVVDGYVTYYYPNGVKESSSYYKKGIARGMSIKYDKNGDVREKNLFENGVCTLTIKYCCKCR